MADDLRYEYLGLKVVHKPLDFGTIGQPIATSKKGQAKLVYNPIKL